MLSPGATIIAGRTVKASFIPGDLHLTETEDGFHVVVMQGGEIFRTRSQKAAAAKFNEFRREMESRYPVAEMTPEEKAVFVQVDNFRVADLGAIPRSQVKMNSMQAVGGISGRNYFVALARKRATAAILVSSCA